jgi:hypothetical protein
VEVEGAVCGISRAGRPIATFAFDSPGALTLGRGAVSPAYGVKLSAPRIVWTGEVAAGGARVTILPA